MDQDEMMLKAHAKMTKHINRSIDAMKTLMMEFMNTAIHLNDEVRRLAREGNAD